MRIRIVAPAGPVNQADLDAGEDLLRRRGFQVSEGGHVRDRTGYLAGEDPGRLDDLQQAIEDDGVDLIWFARGGYGTQRLLPSLRVPPPGGSPKTIAGFSDATALFLWASKCASFRQLYAPSVQELGRDGACDLESLWASLEGNPAPIPAQGPAKSLGPAKIVGGCLSMLSTACGTAWHPETAGKFFFIEDVGERLYRLDRMLTHLRQAGCLSDLAGVLLGSFTGMGEGESPDDVRFRVAELVGPGVPIISGLPVGHVTGKFSMPLDIPASWDGKCLRFSFTSSH